MLRVDIDRPTLESALEGKISILKRNNNAEINPLMKDLRNKDIAKLQNAINTISEINPK